MADQVGARPLWVVAGVVVVAVLPLFVLMASRGPVDGAGDLNEGHWGPKTATVNWCEADYAVTRYVAEFWNSLSSLSIVVIGVFGIVMHARVVEPRYMAAFSSFIVIGLGSAAFHGTLLRSMQLLDELPMVWANSVFVYILIAMEDDVARAPRTAQVLAIAAVTVLMTIAVAVLDKENQDVFLVCYGSGVLFVFWRSLAFDRKYNSRGAVWLLETSLLFYGGGFLLWLTDRNFCPHVRSLYLHVIWHVFAGLGTFIAVIFWIWVRYEFLGRRPRLRGSHALPWIEIGETPG